MSKNKGPTNSEILWGLSRKYECIMSIYFASWLILYILTAVAAVLFLVSICDIK